MPSTHYCGRCLTTFEPSPPTCPNLGCGAARPPEGWGTVLGARDLLDRRYRVERCLAVGGAGLTYLAQEVDDAGAPLGPRLAIKVLYSARASGPFLRRLSTEAQVLQELAHDNIVQLHGFVHRAGHEPYLVTRFEEGGSLAAHLHRVGPLPARVVAGILKQVLLALDTAHQRGVVHRDLKPDNVLLAAPVPRDAIPHVRVADFGIAKIAGGMMGSQVTRVGAFVGTPEFAAPEQFDGQAPTPATDVFAAGGLLYFLATGAPPFVFSHRADIEQSRAEQLEQLPVRLPSIPEAAPSEQAALQEALDQLLVQRPEDRWTIRRVVQALAPLLDTVPRVSTLDITGRPAPTRESLPPAEPTDETLAARTPPPPPSSVPPPPPSSPPVGDGPPAPPPSLHDAPPPPPPTLDSPPPPPPPLDAPPPPPPSIHDAPPEPPSAPLPPTLEDIGPEATIPVEELPPSLRPPTLEPVDPPSDEESPPPPPPPPGPPPPPPRAQTEPSSPEIPAPPPFVPGPPTRPIPAPTPTPAPASGGAGGAVAGAAGCMGLSVAGMTVLGLVGVVLVGVALLGIAFGTGWFDPRGPRVPPVVVDDDVPDRLKDARPLPDGQAKQVQRAARDAAPAIRQRCGVGGQTTLAADLYVTAQGSVQFAKVEPAGLAADARGCVKKGLEKVRAPGVSTEGYAHVVLR